VREACKILRPKLELFADGELLEEFELRRVRRHLARCAICRDFLERHDALTREILADGEESVAAARSAWEDENESFLEFAGPFANEPRSRDRCERTIEGVDWIEDVLRAEQDESSKLSTPAAQDEILRPAFGESSVTRRSFSTLRLASVAAALLVVGLVVQLVFFSGSAVDAPASSRETLAIRSGRPPALSVDDLARMRWVLGEEMRTSAVGRSRMRGPSTGRPNARLFPVVAKDSPTPATVPPGGGSFVVDIRIVETWVDADREVMFYLVLEEELLALSSAGAGRKDGVAGDRGTDSPESYGAWTRWRRVVPTAATLATSWERGRVDRFASVGGQIYRVIPAPRRARIDAGAARSPVAQPFGAASTESSPHPLSSRRFLAPSWRTDLPRLEDERRY
jgi:hypothetical protein